MCKSEYKIWQEYFQDVIDRRKKCEIRKGVFQVGEIFELRETIKETGEYTGRTCICTITDVCDFEQKEGYKVLSISVHE